MKGVAVTLGTVRFNIHQDRQCAHNLILRRFRVAMFAMEKQPELHILRICL